MMTPGAAILIFIIAFILIVGPLYAPPYIGREKAPKAKSVPVVLNVSAGQK